MFHAPGKLAKFQYKMGSAHLELGNLVGGELCNDITVM